MSDQIMPVNIRVLGKDYRIACTEEERDDLLESARYLDQKMREVRDSGKVVGLDRIAVMAALNIAHEFTQANRQTHSGSRTMNDRLIKIQKKIDTILNVKELD